MDIYETIRVCKSVRSYRDTPVPAEMLDRVLDAARRAPSARNEQEWRFVVVRDASAREKIARDAARQPFIATAPIVLACCAVTDGRIMRCGQLAYPIDVAIAMDHLSLAAVAEGLGACWVGAFDEQVVKTILGIPAEVRVVQLMPLGFPADSSPMEKSRLSLEQIVHQEVW